ncbi:hypothetical protein ACH5RR_037322 [Cinchona calisaya]|uniref:Reverse transcriptase zinc-binding domain-containing protein n=1 Tax=Cinchona calisaya TaxID=153742 RepID=A0ABD2Y5V0_9GENT
MNIKNKYKNFVRKCNQRALPVNEVTSIRTGKAVSWYISCENGAKTIEHVLFFCEMGQKFRRIVPILWNGLDHLTGIFRDWWIGLIEAKIEKRGITLSVKL